MLSLQPPREGEGVSALPSYSPAAASEARGGPSFSVQNGFLRLSCPGMSVILFTPCLVIMAKTTLPSAVLPFWTLLAK